jgi:hypothetical protein
MFKAEPGTTTDTWLTPRWVLKNLGKFDPRPVRRTGAAALADCTTKL